VISIRRKTKKSVKEALDWYNPLAPYYFAKDPSMERAAKMALVPTLLFGAGYATTAWLAPGVRYTPQLHMLHRTAATGKILKSAGQSAALGGRALVSPFMGALVTAVTGSFLYETFVNEPLRDAHPGNIDWFGPFASGFGTVV
jgi:hypothetical protein